MKNKNVAVKNVVVTNQLILNVIQDLQRLPLSVPLINNMRGRCQIKFGMTSLCNNGGRRGFTLIELLVVVLIIGILAAVALPQYQRAVEKARLVEVWAGLKAIVAAQEIYKLENGDYTLDFTNLDLDFPGTTYVINEDIENSRIILSNGTTYTLDQDGYWSGKIPTVPVLLEYRWGEKIPYRCRLYGLAVSDQHAHALCKSLGGVFLKEDSYGIWYKLP